MTCARAQISGLPRKADFVKLRRVYGVVLCFQKTWYVVAKTRAVRYTVCDEAMVVGTGLFLCERAGFQRCGWRCAFG